MPELVKLIESARTTGRYADAERLCHEAIDLEPDNPSIRLWLGWIAMDRKAYGEAIYTAFDTRRFEHHDVVGVARLLAYAGALSGDWSVANNALLLLSQSEPEAARKVAIETAPIFLDQLRTMQRSKSWEAAARSFSQVPDILKTAAPVVMREICMTGSICHMALGRAEEAIAIFEQSISSVPRDTVPIRDHPRALLVTSLMATRIEVQKAAVASWRRFGFDVASLNAPDEIDNLRSNFQDVTFYAAGRDARARFGRPLVYIDDILAVLAASAYAIGGIINSDIVFSVDADDVLRRATELAEQAIIFGNRLDINPIDADHPSSPAVYLFGYDWFLLRTDQAKRIAGAEMVLGAPWWDIWLPLRAKSLGLDIVNVRHPIAIHEQHAMRWRPGDQEEMGRELARAFITDSNRCPLRTRFGSRLSLVVSILKDLNPSTFADQSFLDWLAALLRGTVQLEAVPFDIETTRHVTSFWDFEGQI